MDSTEKKTRGKRGQGCIYRRKGSRNWWIKFSFAGRHTKSLQIPSRKKRRLTFSKSALAKNRRVWLLILRTSPFLCSRKI